MAKGMLRILMVVAMLLTAVACGSSGIDNGVSSQNNHGEKDIDKGTQR